MINSLEFFEREEVVNMGVLSKSRDYQKSFTSGIKKIYGIRNVNYIN